jgi:dihydroorotate dehydrogenase electron transfer subunit
MPMLRTVHEVAASLDATCEVSLESHMACGIGVCLGCAHGTADGGLIHVCKDGPVVDSRAVFGPGAEGGAAG